MRRRDVIAGAAGGAAAALALPGGAESPAARWRLVSSFPRTLDNIFGAADLIARAVAEASEGRFQIQTFAPGEIVSALSALDAVSAGTVECALTPLYLAIGKEPALAFGTGAPFGLNARQQQAWWMFGGGREIIDEALKPFNVTSFVAGNSGCQMGGWFRKEIREPADLKGLKFRIAGLGGQVLARLGAVPQQIAAGDVYAALERGAIDAAEFVGPYDDEKLGFARVAPYYYYPGWWEGSAMMHLVVGLPAWSALSKSHQAMLRQACAEANTWMLARYDATNGPALSRLISSGVRVRAYPRSVLDACRQAADELYAEIGSRSPLFKRASESVRTFADEQRLWQQIADHWFDAYMIGARAEK